MNCLKCKKKADSKNLKVTKTKKWKLIILSRYVVCDNEKSKFIKEEDASGLLSSQGIKTTVRSGIPIPKSISF